METENLSAKDDIIRGDKAILGYLVENCISAYDELCKVNRELVEGMAPNSNADVNRLGMMNRVLQDYVIIRVGGLFDRVKYKTRGETDEVISFEKLYSGDKGLENVKGQEIIKYIIKQRHNFTAHTNRNHIEKNFPVTAKICDSNLKTLLEILQKLLKS